MANKFTRNMTDIRDIKSLKPDTNNQNDLLSTTDYDVFLRTHNKDTKDHMYYELTDAIKSFNEITTTKEEGNAITWYPKWNEIIDNIVDFRFYREGNVEDLTLPLEHNDKPFELYYDSETQLYQLNCFDGIVSFVHANGATITKKVDAVIYQYKTIEEIELNTGLIALVEIPEDDEYLQWQTFPQSSYEKVNTSTNMFIVGRLYTNRVNGVAETASYDIVKHGMFTITNSNSGVTIVDMIFTPTVNQGVPLTQNLVPFKVEMNASTGYTVTGKSGDFALIFSDGTTNVYNVDEHIAEMGMNLPYLFNSAGIICLRLYDETLNWDFLPTSAYQTANSDTNIYICGYLYLDDNGSYHYSVKNRGVLDLPVIT